MTLQQCTKEELISIIQRILSHLFTEEQRQSEIKFRLQEIEFKRKQKLLKEAENWGVIADEKRKEYIDLLQPYDGKLLITVPADVIKRRKNF